MGLKQRATKPSRLKYFLFVGLGLISLACFLFYSSEPTQTIPDVATTNYCESIEGSHNEKLSNILSEFSHRLVNETGVYPLDTGESAMLSRAWLSEAAEKTIDVQYFIFSKDNVGLIAFDYLVRAADRGVKVRVLVDDFMVEFEEHEILAVASHPNISIKVYNPGVNLGKNIYQKIKKFATDFKGANQRMHNKQFIVDENVLITGGRNIESMYFDFDHKYNFRDRDVLLLGKAAREGQASFDEYWRHPLSVDVNLLIGKDENKSTQKNSFKGLHEYACNPENYWPQVRNKVKGFSKIFRSPNESVSLVWTSQVEMICDAPGKNSDTDSFSGSGKTTDKLVQLIASAKSSVDIQSPYLVTSKITRQLFADAVDRNVNIRILTNSLASTDNVEAFSGYQRDRDELLATGVRIFEFRPDAAVRLKIAASSLQKRLNHQAIFGMHAKTMVVDEKTTVIGTFNLDPRSAHLNTECLAIIENKQVAETVLEGIEEEFKPENSWETTTDWNPDKTVDLSKRFKTWTRNVIPKDVL